MYIKKIKVKIISITVLISLIFMSCVTPVISAENVNINRINAFEKGIPWQKFETLKKVTFVNFDKETLIDDYAYLASIPASIFSNGDMIFSSPLLFFQSQNSYPNEIEYKFLNDYMGTHYFMEDFMGYCNGKLDQITTINVDKEDLEDSWDAENYCYLNNDNSFNLAAQIALNEWSYSKKAIIAVIEENYEKPENTNIMGYEKGVISGNVHKESLKVNRGYGPAPVFEKFKISDAYKYIKADLWYPAVSIKSNLLTAVPGFAGARIVLPSIDPDFQLYCMYKGDWLQTSSAAEMAITGGPHEQCFSYVYNPGDWRVGVTNMPTEGGDDEEFSHYLFRGDRIKIYGSNIDALKNLLGTPVTKFNVDLTMYPGVEVDISDLPPFGCRNASFKLNWNNQAIKLGLTIIGPSGEEVYSVLDEEKSFQEIYLDQLGECLDGEQYKAVVFALTDVASPVEFNVSYSWQQNITRKEADLIASSCEGAILGSLLNAPLLYTTPSDLSDDTISVLYKLGVDEIFIVDIGGYLTKNVRNEIANVAEIKEHFSNYLSVYDYIMSISGQNDIIFSTIDPWSYWFYQDKPRLLKPEGEFKKAYVFAPASYAAAFHGSPLILVDNHPELSGAIMWHNEFWKKSANGYKDPPIAPLFLTGTRAYEFLREIGLNKEGVESMLSIAGQYDIGPTWTRTFAGVANSGAIIGTPVDVTNHICRCIFYPGLIFENPALKGKVELVNGSKSIRVQPSIIPFRPFQGLIERFLKRPIGSNLKIVRPSRVEEYTYPVLHTYGCYSYRFNERGEDYWQAWYETRDGIIPGITESYADIDQGVRMKFEGLSGGYHADLSESETTPFYASKAGYGNAYSMDFDITMDNLNKGVITWYMVLHGNSDQGGILAWYSPTALTDGLVEQGMNPTLAKIFQYVVGIPLGLNPTIEDNPWRGYDQLWGSTAEPDSATLASEVGLVLGILGLANPDGPLNGGFIKTGLDFVPTNTPLTKNSNYYDGLVGPYSITAMITKFTYSHPALEVDEKLKNLYSMAFYANSCLIGCNYLQIAFLRHGSAIQELDPWGTSYWGGVAFQELPRDFAIGKTVGQAYAEGRCKIGIKYVFEPDEERVWWWDNAQNIVLFGDPDLRIWVPSTEYDAEAKNHWERDDVEPLTLKSNEELNIDGHIPFGAAYYPNKREPELFLPLWLLFIIALIFVLIILVAASGRRKKKRIKK